MANKPRLFLLFLFSFVLSGSYAQLSYEHISHDVVKYPINGNEAIKASAFQGFLNETNTAILFDFENNRDQEYLFEKEFISLLKQLNDYLENNQDRVKTIFFKSVSEVWVEKLFNQTGLSNRRYTHGFSQLWPSLIELSKNGKQLIVFFKGAKNSSIIVNGKYVHSSRTFQLSKEVTWPGQLLFLNIQPSGNPGNEQFQLPPGFVDSFINIWKKTGQVPNFILMDEMGFRQNIPLILNSTEKLQGNISFETTGLGAINWAGNFTSTTGNTFCFPAYAGEKISLAPQSPGFSFVPQQLNFQGGSEEVVGLKSIKKKLTDGTVAYFPLEENINDLSPKSLQATNNGIEFVEDYNRSKVAALKGKHFAQLPNLKELEIVNESFTISTWIKLDKIDNEDQMILSSIQNKYSEGLYILVRKKKPYFAFYHNDLEGKTILEPNKWYNIVWRYRKELQEQSIFINGQLDSLANGRPPLRGVGNIVLGHREAPSGTKTYFNGYIDDLVFWNRALGENEIRNVYEGNLELESRAGYSLFIWVGGISTFLILLILIFQIRAKGKSHVDSPNNIIREDLPPINVKRNAIFIFGGLKVLDRDGVNITNAITPKLKELFILLYLSTLKDRKGISSGNLSSNIWPGLSRENAINNRGVSTAKLRQILGKLDGVGLKYNNQFWTVEVDDQVYSDYKIFLDIIKNSKVENMEQLSLILKSGDFLPNVSKEWLDPYKFEVSNKVIDIYTPRLEVLWRDKKYDLLIEYCEIILTFDVVHETAIKYKVDALKKQKKHEQALKVYQSFVNLYYQFYKEEFVIEFNDFHP